MSVRLHILVSGRVQGVAYRASTQAEARRLHLTGWVRNLDDGRVEAVVEGPRKAVESLLVWCRRGPPAARVEHVDAVEQPATGEFASFEVRR